MALEPAQLPSALYRDELGVIRVTGTRILLETLLEGYLAGQTPAELHADYPTVTPAAIHTILDFYQHRKTDIDVYLEESTLIATTLQRDIEATYDKAALRARLASRFAAMKAASHATPTGG